MEVHAETNLVDANLLEHGGAGQGTAAERTPAVGSSSAIAARSEELTADLRQQSRRARSGPTQFFTKLENLHAAQDQELRANAPAAPPDGAPGLT
jgi:hypothetical protein